MWSPPRCRTSPMATGTSASPELVRMMVRNGFQHGPQAHGCGLSAGRCKPETRADPKAMQARPRESERSENQRPSLIELLPATRDASMALGICFREELKRRDAAAQIHEHDDQRRAPEATRIRSSARVGADLSPISTAFYLPSEQASTEALCEMHRSCQPSGQDLVLGSIPFFARSLLRGHAPQSRSA